MNHKTRLVFFFLFGILFYFIVFEYVLLLWSHYWYSPNTMFNGFTKTSLRYLIVTNNVGNIYNQTKLLENRMHYCELDNCDFVIETNPHHLETHGAWMKLYQYLDFQDKYRFIWFLDADAFILKSNVSISKLADAYSNQCIIATLLPIQNSISTGSFIMNRDCSDIVYEALKYRYNTVFPRAYEQYALNQVRLKRRDIGFKIVPHGLIESFYFSVTKGDLVLHVPIFTPETKKYVFKKNIEYFKLEIL